jgi:hypothetical protein
MRRQMMQRSAAAFAVATILGVSPGFAQQSDPPAFAPISVRGGEVIAINVFCFEHGVGGALPTACRGELMFHDVSGRELRSIVYELEPGSSTSLRLPVPATTASGTPIQRVLIIPCIIPAPGGPAVPTVEVFDREAGRVVLFQNPVAARASALSDGTGGGGADSGAEAGSDPPAFGMTTIRSDQTMRMNVFCFEHAAGPVAAPSACHGTVMFHDVAGNVLRRGTYDLEPGQSRSFVFLPPETRLSLAGIIPCVLPDPGGHAVPDVEVVDADGSVRVLMPPAAAHLSQFQVLQPR